MNNLNWEFLIGPIVGGVIGYITNGIAIKMLFRPLKPIYILGVKLPFTPGIIPKEKGRIARSIGQIVGGELINEEVLRKVLLQESIYAKIDEKIDELIEEYEISELTVKEVCERVIAPPILEEIGDQVGTEIADKIYTKVSQLNLGQIAVAYFINEMKEGSFKSLFGAFAFFINDSLIENIGAKLEPIINQMISDKGKALIEEGVREEGEAFFNRPINKAIVKVKEKSELIKKAVRESYIYFVKNNLSNALKIIDLSQVAEERINAFDTLELEKMILQIMSKELNAIIWLGALLGAILGCILSLV